MNRRHNLTKELNIKYCKCRCKSSNMCGCGNQPPYHCMWCVHKLRKKHLKKEFKERPEFVEHYKQAMKEYKKNHCKKCLSKKKYCDCKR